MKKIVLKFITLVYITVCFLTSVSYAFEVEPYASDYFRTYSASASSTSTGEYKIVYTITPAGRMDQVGVSEIRVYTSKGSLVQTIVGTEDNGLIKTNTGNRVMDTYKVTNLMSGQRYYAEVDIYAEDNAGSDARTILANTVTIK